MPAAKKTVKAVKEVKKLGLGKGEAIVLGDIKGKETTTVSHEDGTTITFPANKDLRVPCPRCDSKGTIFSGTRICDVCDGECVVVEKYK